MQSDMSPEPATLSQRVAAGRESSTPERAVARAQWLVPAFGLLVGAMLIVQALAGDASRKGSGGALTAYWISFSVIVAAAVGAQLLRSPTRMQRLGLVLVTGAGLYMIKVVAYPNGFTYYDELSHYRTAADILRFGRAFHANPALAVSPYYPGLEASPPRRSPGYPGCR